MSAAWPRLEAWYEWFNTSQAGSVPTTYRWVGGWACACVRARTHGLG